MSLADLRAFVRSIAANVVPGGSQQNMSGNSRGDLSVAQGLPPLVEIVRLGNSYSVNIPLANHFTTVAAQPTTRAEMLIWNGEAGGGKSYVMDSLWFLADTTQAAATQGSLLVQLVPQTGSGAQVTPPTDNATVKALVNCRSGKSSYGGKGRLAIANTAFMIADKWETVGYSGGAASASIGFGIFADLKGGWVVPPGAVFGINAIVGTAAATSATMGMAWHEVQLDLG